MLNRKTLLGQLPPEWPVDLLDEIHQAIEASGEKVVVLDDDPTGSQTVHDVDVLTVWDVDTLVDTFRNPESVVYILTNTRSMDTGEAISRNVEIISNLNVAAVRTHRSFVIVSRSDSTLRGHYPAETDAVQAALPHCTDGVLIIPVFIEGGRITVHNVHYVTEGESLIPASETEYAADPTFGYTASNLCDWVEEKTHGEVNLQEVRSITLDDIRLGGPQAVADQFTRLVEGQVCIVNCISYRDLEVIAAGALRAEAKGKRFLYRTAASFVRVRGAITPVSSLTAEHLPAVTGGGLVVAGSYVGKTSRQLERLRLRPDLTWVELSAGRVVDEETRSSEIARARHCVQQAVAGGENVVLYTSRERIVSDSEAFLKLGDTISQALVDIVSELKTRPAWIIAKGGITASVIATDALEMRCARVLGQVIPGVPVWRTGDESRWPGLIYVVFPGNVGDDDALSLMVKTLILSGRKNAG